MEPSTWRSPAELRVFVEAAARAAGATAFGVTAANADPLAYERLRASFGRGDLATWVFDEAYALRASDPRTLLRDARSVVCVAIPYARPRPRSRPRPLAGRVANYAWSRDYHRVVRDVLDRVRAALDEFADTPGSTLVCDTAPLAERALAARAGLGWTGKHTNLIVPSLGSFVFLGELLTTLEIAPDAPLKKTCGSCSRCVTACPTGALRGDYTLDARRCISDLTQRTDDIPRELRPLIGDWIWGCDLCQDVCPPTQLAGGSANAAFDPEGEAAAPDLLELLSLRSGAFKRRYRGTGMGWRGAAVLRRNAAVALGNALDRAAVPALERSLALDPHAGVRGHAAWALGRIGSPRARAWLAARAPVEHDPGVRIEIAAALER